MNTAGQKAQIVRINRKLVPEGYKLYTSKGPRQYQDGGSHYVVDTRTSGLVDSDVDLDYLEYLANVKGAVWARYYTGILTREELAQVYKAKEAYRGELERMLIVAKFQLNEEKIERLKTQHALSILESAQSLVNLLAA